MATDRRTLRCAIYTRKSTEEGLEQAFNSLDAQYEACTAYVASQHHEGWRLARERYDDGGFSGGSMARPALKQLLADIDAGRIDIVVVYKVDRLTRSLADFAKIVEILDARSASFVSVTQAFNTTTSMGRLTLNVLLSFAQFEREVTGERIRDKIAASKKKGMWMGGPVPLGYRLADRKLMVEADEARIVQHIFTRYLALGSGQLLIEELYRDGFRTKRRQQSNRIVGDVPFTRGMLFHMLGNPIYRGMVRHKDAVYPGEHPAIVSAELWDEVQCAIAKRRVEQPIGKRQTAPSLLAGLLSDGHGRRMSPSHAVKGRVRYRYYITHAGEQRAGSPPQWRMPAPPLEAMVVARIAELLVDRAMLLTLIGDAPAAEIAKAIAASQNRADALTDPTARRTTIRSLVRSIVVGADLVEIVLDKTELQKLLGIPIDPTPEALVLQVPAVKVRQGKATRLVIGDRSETKPSRDEQLVALIREAQAARRLVLESPTKSLRTVAAEQRRCRHRLAKLVRLSWLDPSIVAAILDGRQPASMTTSQLINAKLPLAWSDQAELLGVS